MPVTFSRRGVWYCLAPLCAAALSLAIGPAPRALAAPGWSTPKPVLPPGTAYSYISAPAVDAVGDTFIAYADNTKLWLVKRSAAGVFGAPVLVAANGDLGAPHIAVDAAGDVVIGWLTGYGSSNLDPFVATVSAAGAVSFSGLPLKDPGGHLEINTEIVVASNAAGEAAVAWTSPAELPPSRVEVETRANPTQGFGSLTTIGGIGPGVKGPTSQPAAQPTISVDDAGNVVLAYQEAGEILEMTGPLWPLVPTRLQSAESISPVAASTGDYSIIAWVDRSTSPQVVEASLGIGSSSGVFLGTYATLSQGSAGIATGPGPSAAIDAAGDAVVAWTETPSAYVRAAYRPSGGTFGSELQISNPQWGTPGTVAALAAGGVGVVGWQNQLSGGSTPYVTAARTIAANGTLGAIATVGESASGGVLNVSARSDAAGEAVFGWEDYGGSNFELAAYDTAGPALAAPAIPATALVGAPATFSVAAPLDTWSPPVATTWSFGDGTGANGSAVAHAYASPGTYTVTVTATDALGNATSRSGQIVVSAPPAGPPSPAARHCVVPSLSHISPALARTRLAQAGCSLGKSRKARKRKRARGLAYGVVSQSPAAGRVEPLNAKVEVTLGWFKAHSHKPPKRRKHGTTRRG
jgi:hypothetical protein